MFEQLKCYGLEISLNRRKKVEEGGQGAYSELLAFGN